MAFLQNLVSTTAAPQPGLETWSLELPNGRVISRRLPMGATDAQVRQIFAEDLASAGYRNPRRHQVQRPPLSGQQDAAPVHSNHDPRFQFFMVPGLRPSPEAAFVESALAPTSERFRNSPSLYPGLPLSSGRLSAYYPTLGERIENEVRNGLISLGVGRHTTQDLTGAARDVPMLGDAMNLGDAGSAFGRGNLLEGTGLMTLAVAGMVPGMGDVVAAAGRQGLRRIRRAAARYRASPARGGGYHATDGLGNVLAHPNDGPRTPPPRFQTQEEALRAAPGLSQRMSETARNRRERELGYSQERFWHGDRHPLAPEPLPDQYPDHSVYFSRDPDYAAAFARLGGRPEAREFRLRFNRPFRIDRMYSRDEVADILGSLRRLDDEVGADRIASVWHEGWTAEDFIADAARRPSADASDGANIHWLLRENSRLPHTLVLRDAGYDSIDAGHELVKLSSDGIRLRSAEFDPRRADSLNINHALAPMGVGLGSYGLLGDENN